MAENLELKSKVNILIFEYHTSILIILLNTEKFIYIGTIESSRTLFASAKVDYRTKSKTP